MSTPSPDRWQQISPYLDHALSLSEDERTAWLKALREGRPDLADVLEELLEEHRALAQEEFLEHAPLRPPNESSTGQTIGAYTLISRIGQGGMGSVWLAERSDGRFRRQVAVKFLHFALAAHGAAERFKREGRILGQLAHPHIAELIDAGIGQNGEPYLVLEYVEGEHIDRYCDEHKLDVNARIKLFLDVLRAVALAHTNLIVHRDIKPSNVLVRNDGEVKLLDFGIAKLLAEDGTAASATQLTIEGGGALTPQFAAPEQVSGGPITTATDVYALGVLLYLLLTGQHPAGRGGHSPADLVKAIVETEPLRASEAITSPATAANAERRRTTPEKLCRELRGDLDTIVGKALKKNPQERYPSVASLGDDLQRYLRQEPIAARPDNFGYRAAKFVRRNLTAVALATLALLAIAAGVTGTRIQARTARKQRDFALRQLSRAEAINDLNNYVLSNAAPSGKPFTVDDLLSGAEHIVRRQQGDETTRAELLISIGRQYTVQDEYQKARRLLEEAHVLSRTLSEHSTRARASCGLGQVLSRTGDFARGEALFHEGLDELPNDPLFVVERVFCLLRGSEIAENGGRQEESLARAEAAEGMVRQSSFHSDPLELDALIVLAGAYSDAGRRGEAGRAYQQAAARLQELGRDDTQMAGILFNNWGTMLIGAGRPLDAERALRRTIEIGRDAQGEDSVSSMTLANYSYALYQIGRFDEAASYAARAYAKASKSGDEMAANQALFHRARICRSNGDLRCAADMLAKVEPQLRRTLPPGHIAFAVLASERALNAQASGDLQNALKLADQAVSISEPLSKRGGGGVNYAGRFLVRRSAIELQLGGIDAALEDATRALPMLQQSAVPGCASADVGYAYLALGRALHAEGKSDLARPAFASAADQLSDALGAGHSDSRAAREYQTPDEH